MVSKSLIAFRSPLGGAGQRLFQAPRIMGKVTARTGSRLWATWQFSGAKLGKRVAKPWYFIKSDDRLE
jgi:hypothetical protein